jgi:glycosyl transferase family 2
MPNRSPLSIVLATTDPWPDLANCLEVLEPQVAAVGGEIIVGDGHGQAVDAVRAGVPDRVRIVRMPGASVFDLRARAVEIARGEIIAITEDHCLVGPDWCEQVLAMFSLHPDVMVVSGPVLNGSRNHLIDWANYLHTFGSFFPPFKEGHRHRGPSIANLAFRRNALPSGSVPPGRMEFELFPRLFREGRCRVHNGMTVTHVQSHGFWKTFRSHFDNGRSTTGLRPVPFSERQRAWRLFRTAVRTMGGGPEIRATIRASLPLVFVLSCCHAFGEIVGILAGPGRSPARLR